MTDEAKPAKKQPRYPSLSKLRIALTASHISKDDHDLLGEVRYYPSGAPRRDYPFHVQLGCQELHLDSTDVAALKQFFTELPRLIK